MVSIQPIFVKKSILGEFGDHFTPKYSRKLLPFFLKPTFFFELKKICLLPKWLDDPMISNMIYKTIRLQLSAAFFFRLGFLSGKWHFKLHSTSACCVSYQTMQMHANFQGYPYQWYSVWVVDIMTPFCYLPA